MTTLRRLVGLSLLGLCIGGHAAAARTPNLVLILTDDEDVELHHAMPKTAALLAAHGTTLADFFVTSPLCCPSRASLLRGQYPHSTGVRTNSFPDGGFARFFRDAREHSTLATWLQAAGYRTIFAGKYLNHYGNAPWSQTYIPPGWSEWLAGLAHGYRGYDYTLNDGGTVVARGHAPQDYLTDVLAARSAHAIRSATAARVPFLLFVAPFSPHEPATPAPRHADRFLAAPLPLTPSFDEADVSDKPSFIGALPRLSKRTVEQMTAFHRRRLQALQAIDDLVETIVLTLDAVGELDRTVIIYTSDNGHHLGAHRLPAGKSTPYEEDIRVPFVIRGPGIAAGVTRTHLALNTDVAPTLTRLAGVEPPAFVDGRSLLPILGASTPTTPWRQSFLVERGTSERLDDVDDALERLPPFRALRGTATSYAEWADGSRELYDLAADPGQLDNRFATASAERRAALAERTRLLGRCAARDCRTLEDLPLP